MSVKRPVTYRLKPITIKILHVWATLNDVAIEPTIVACLTRWIAQQAERRGKPFATAYRKAAAVATSAAWTKEYLRQVSGKPAPAEVLETYELCNSGPKRQVGLALELDVATAVRLFCAMDGQRPSQLADAAIRGYVLQLAAARGKQFLAGFTAAVECATWPEDEGDNA